MLQPPQSLSRESEAAIGSAVVLLGGLPQALVGPFDEHKGLFRQITCFAITVVAVWVKVPALLVVRAA